MKLLTTDQWVRKLNQLTEKMAENERMLHPSAWAEANAELMAYFRELAQQPTYDPPTQLELGL